MTDDSAALLSAKPRIAINGQSRTELEPAVLNMRVNLPFSGMSHAELKLLNWGSTDGNGEARYAFQSISLGDRVEISIGESTEAPIFNGEVTALEEMYGQGAPRLVLLLEDKLHRLAKQRNSRAFESMSVNDVVQNVLADASLSGDIQVSSDTGVWHQLNETNLGFLQRLLWPYAIPVRCSGDNVRAKAEEEDAQPVEIHTQSGVTSLRVIADLNGQYQSAQVKGFNLEANEPVSGSENDPNSSSGKSAKQLLSDLGWGGDDLFVYPFARNASEGNAWATAMFGKQAKEFLRGDVLLAGNAKLKTGKQIELSGASDRLNGKYNIVQAQHLFDTAGGYKTRLKFARNFWNQN